MSHMIQGDGEPTTFTLIFCSNNENIETQIFGILSTHHGGSR